jgi:hypothetical protein
MLLIGESTPANFVNGTSLRASGSGETVRPLCDTALLETLVPMSLRLNHGIVAFES